jgi:hypothetical protein
VIKYEQVGDNEPKDIKVITDDGNAELAMLDDELAGWEAKDNLDAAVQGEDGNWTFLIPGHEAGEIAEGLDPSLRLEAFLDDLNHKALHDGVDVSATPDDAPPTTGYVDGS